MRKPIPLRADYDATRLRQIARESEDADQVTDAALKALDLLGGTFGLHCRVRPRSSVASVRRAAREARPGTPPAAQRTDSAGACRR